MAVEVFMPKAGMDMQEGTIIQWLKNVGEAIEEGEALLEIETDKVAMEVESPAMGVLLCRYFEDGAVVPVVTTIGYVGEPGEVVPDKPLSAGIGAVTASAEVVETVEIQKLVLAAETNAVKATPYAKKMAQTNAINLHEVPPTGPVGEIKGRDVEREIAKSPLARRIAEDHGIDLSAVTGSGHQNKVMKSDVLAKIAEQKSPAEVEAVQNTTPLSGMQKVVGERMVKAHTEIPSVTQNTKVDMTKLLAFRKQINENREKRLTINDFIVKAVAKVLLYDKKVLVSLGDKAIIHHQDVNIGIAVALDEGLIVPVVKNADKKSLEEISETIKSLSAKAKSGGLMVDDYQGSTISISNLGMFGVHSFTPIVNQPNAVIIGICAIEDELALVDKQVENRKKMMISLTYDHRLVNGDVAAKFSMKVRDLLENPMEILL
ncbi:2-oxo acid dehydrogenase subunit E2 [Acetobacterium wieringae]|uniref:Dihydrolipoamide acetyltransferase component of pyruvate dehydrogenase complex n=1 Tax=Acetobacterium wieringae TaxID=52694 RepID=A0ABY6HGP0_9FIRM|nr:dihydrolipoamide acetyltransferase family protein [Acetobacterium wieringae]UYO63450.1 2-oxo acid dehydrogenase subunit E2 [Acetobacterium wieringae]VUZ27160.1 Dihydrolipoyllysine-residue succinyltransferase component of 2-oxoglutarate dehydrogenase complex [Acetobacterium wieringae]